VPVANLNMSHLFCVKDSLVNQVVLCVQQVPWSLLKNPNKFLSHQFLVDMLKFKKLIPTLTLISAVCLHNA